MPWGPITATESFWSGIMDSLEKLKMDDLVSKMKELIGPVDTECAHAEADQLLIEALKKWGHHEWSEDIEELIKAYEEVNKWYA